MNIEVCYDRAGRECELFRIRLAGAQAQSRPAAGSVAERSNSEYRNGPADVAELRMKT
ncbi:hypothetical protein PGT21_037017 [Puccinia graminis f. sp. tritici]|uniref:Uncharacterized protein n=1 Tax=Puccinia graminis f. sp. tritici TaxID=56615 RepID=A0A5B0R3L6_PUCGR|nr:hypothetical protein PGT21_032959 [Puccinia graminis f. sp. tritici]KAA1120030.1 hypothetical protein PGT21_037017 [Puccinia graminis f. sp. tritici]